MDKLNASDAMSVTDFPQLAAKVSIIFRITFIVSRFFIFRLQNKWKTPESISHCLKTLCQILKNCYFWSFPKVFETSARAACLYSDGDME